MLVLVTDLSENEDSEAMSTTSENEDEEDESPSQGDDEPGPASCNGRKSNISLLLLDPAGGGGKIPSPSWPDSV